MIIVVDTNIIFSACLTPDNRIYQILQNSTERFQFISQSYAIEELHNHKDKLLKLSNRTSSEMDVLIDTVLKRIVFYDAELIEPKFWMEADRLTKNVDSKDVSFVAMALKTKGQLWTGDKKLMNHLYSFDFNDVVSTSQLYDILIES